MTGATRSPTACPACGGSPPEGARFCPACATPLAGAVPCPECGAPCPAEAHYCAACGQGLGAASAAERRVITILFADLSGFTSLTETLDPEEVHGLIAGCLRPLCECVTRWGGFVDKFIGDCVMALFGAPVAYENEPERAVRAALDMQVALRRWMDEMPESADGPAPGVTRRRAERPALRLSIGVNTGPVVTGLFSGGGARDYTAIGDTVNVAARLQGACEPGGILVGQATWEQTRHVFDFGPEQVLHVKGKREPVHARYVLGLSARRGEIRGFRGRHTPLVGRERELARLRERWSEAEGGRSGSALVLGAPGIGKSRLLRELVRAEGLGEGEVARCRCYPYANSTPWEPIAELLRDLHELPSGVDPTEAASTIADRVPGDWGPRERAALAAALGGPARETAELADYGAAERFAAVSGAVARAVWTPADRPRLLIAEDLHWADRTTLEFLCGAGGQGPLLAVLVTRPPVAGERLLARLVESVEDRIELSPLSREDSLALVDELLGRHALPDELLELVLERAGGNPLFIEEILKTLADRGDLREEEGVWRTTADPETIGVSVPDSIETLLSTRIDQLDAPSKRVLQYASIVGRRFWSEVVGEVLARQPVDHELEELVRGRFVRPADDSLLAGSREFLFEHLLLQEVAYEGLLRGLRAELHAAVAAWLESRLGSMPQDRDDWIAYHYERSNEPGRALPYLERAAAGAMSRAALLDARTLAERALAVASRPEDQMRVLGVMEEIATELADERRREGALEQMETLAHAHDDAALVAEARYRRARFLLGTGELQTARTVGEEALRLFERLGNIDREGDCATLLGRVAHLWGEYREALARYRAALPLQREVGDRFGEADNLDRLGLVEVDVGHFFGAIDNFEAARELCRALGDRPMEARILAHHATALRWLGLFAEAERMAREAAGLARACGSTRALASAELTLGIVLAAADRAEEARPLLVEVCRVAAESGRRGLEARAWLERAEVEEADEAVRCAGRARELARPAGLVHVAILAATREAEVALARGDLGAADAASHEALEGLRRHGNIQGPEERVLYVRGRVLRALRRETEAEALLHEAADAIRQMAELIPDPDMRRRYLEELTENRVILEAAGHFAAPRGREAGVR